MKEKILGRNGDEDYNCIFEYDLEYPKEHNDLPLASQCCNNRLCTTLFDKKDYVVHFRNQKYYLQNRIQLKYIRKVIMYVPLNRKCV